MVRLGLQDKHYSRDWFIRGRLRVELKNSEGVLHNPEVPNRKRPWRALASWHRLFLLPPALSMQGWMS